MIDTSISLTHLLSPQIARAPQPPDAGHLRRLRLHGLTDAGAAYLIQCADEHVATELAADRNLKGKCLRAGDQFVVVREDDLNAVRKLVRKLGYVWPVSGD